jgi:hypothetical protein
MLIAIYLIILGAHMNILFLPKVQILMLIRCHIGFSKHVDY